MSASFQRISVFVDGENLVQRFQGMLTEGRVQYRHVIHERDVFVWSPTIFDSADLEITRIGYYTSAVGDPDKLNGFTDRIRENRYKWTNPLGGPIHQRRLWAHVFKKDKQERKSRQVDIHITLDSIRAAYSHDVGAIALLTGDGDFVPVAREIMRHGKQVLVYAFSSGLSPELKRTCDYFLSLDDHFLQ